MGKATVTSATRKQEIADYFRPAMQADSVSEWLKLAMDKSALPECSRVTVLKYVGGGWSHMTTLDDIGPGFAPEGAEAFLLSTWKAGRFRFRAHGPEGTILAYSPIALIGNWQDAETQAGVAPVAPVKPLNGVSVLAEKVADRIDAATMMATVDKLDAIEQNRDAAKTFGPMSIMVSMMETFQRMTERMTERPKEDSTQASMMFQFMMQMQQHSNAMMLELIKARESGQGSTLGAIGEVVKIMDAVRTSFGVTPGEGDTLDKIGKVIEVASPMLREAIGRWPQSPNGPAALPASTPEPAHGEEPMKPGALTEILDVVVNALKSQDFETAHAMVMNLVNPATGQPLVRINPKAQPVAYATLFGMYDPRFKTMVAEIKGYLDWLRAQIEAEEADDEEDRGGEG
jgi:hypothetical protein